MRFKKFMLCVFVFWATSLVSYDANAQGNFPISGDRGSCEGWMPCGWEKAWLGDSLAYVQRKCGMPSQALYGPPLMITETDGPVSVTRFVRTIYYLYPGYGRNGTMYFLKFQDLRLVSICQQSW